MTLDGSHEHRHNWLDEGIVAAAHREPGPLLACLDRLADPESLLAAIDRLRMVIPALWTQVYVSPPQRETVDDLARALIEEEQWFPFNSIGGEDTVVYALTLVLGVKPVPDAEPGGAPACLIVSAAFLLRRLSGGDNGAWLTLLDNL